MKPGKEEKNKGIQFNKPGSGRKRSINFLALGLVSVLIMGYVSGSSLPLEILETAFAGQPPALEDTSLFEEGFKGGWEDEDPFTSIDDTLPAGAENTPAKSSKLHLGGFMELEAEVGFEKKKEELSLFRPLLFVETEYRINENHKFRASGQAWHEGSYGITSRDLPGAQFLDDRESDFEVKDLYLDSSLNDIFSMRAGRQIIAWGDSNYARITDVVNPRDLTRPGLMDLKDSRLPVAALRLSAVYDDIYLDLVSIHEHPGSKLSGIGSDFDYYASLRHPSIYIQDKQTPDTGFSDAGFAFKATRSFNGGDISLVAANTFDDQPVLFFNEISNLGILEYTPRYEKYKTLGLSASLVRDAALFKLETAFRLGRALQRNDIMQQVFEGISPESVRNFEDRNQVEILTGLEYTGISHLILLLESKLLHTLDHDSFLAIPEYEYQTYFQANYEMLRETLDLELFWVYFYPGHGHLLRMSCEYDILDDISVQVGAAFYLADNSDSVIYAYRDMDRLFFRFKYFF